MCILNKYVVGL